MSNHTPSKTPPQLPELVAKWRAAQKRAEEDGVNAKTHAEAKAFDYEALAYKECADELEATLAADAGGPVPDGWKLVPMEPTREMIDAGVMFGNSPNKASIIYQNMIHAALNPPLPRDFHPDGMERTGSSPASPPVEGYDDGTGRHRDYSGRATPPEGQSALVQTALRNLPQYIGKASFSSSVDKQAALHCVAVLADALSGSK